MTSQPATFAPSSPEGGAAASSDFTRREWRIAWAAAGGLQLSLFVMFALASRGDGVRMVPPAATDTAIPIAVTPVLDDLPLLKLGGKRVRTKLPDLWKKNPPIQRYEAASAPSPMASQSPEAAATSPLAKLDAAVPPPDAEVAREVDQVLLDAGSPDAQPSVEGEGSPDGVKEGTETDPMKARIASQYLMKILGWFNARFRQPDIACHELKKLRVSVAVRVGPDRSVTGYNIAKPSGDPRFDDRVRSTLDSLIGQTLPPPPPLYPDLLDTTVRPVFQGKCE